MLIKEVTEQTGLTKKAIRYYEECGFIKPARKENGYKNYEKEDVAVLLEIKKLRLLDFSVQEIKDYLEGDKQAVIERRMKANKETIDSLNYIQKGLEELLKENVCVSKEIVQRKKTEQLKTVRLNFWFGMANLLLFIILTTINLLGIYESRYSFVSFAFIAVILAGLGHRQEKSKKQGNIIYRKKRIDYALILLLNVMTSNMAFSMIRDCMQSLIYGYGDFYTKGANVFMILLQVILLLGYVAVTFVDSFRKDIEFES